MPIPKPQPVVVLMLGWLCLLAPGPGPLRAATPVPSTASSSAGAGTAGARFRDLSPRSTASGPGFRPLPPSLTGLALTNLLTGDARITNVVAHNGSGVALGDIDGDERPDVYLAVLEGPNRLYRNLGGMKFAEIDAGDAACPNQRSSGTAFADVDGDGDLDLLVNGIAAGTRLFLNDGRGGFREKTDSGLSRTTSPMSLALADIDGDGDLDLYCANYADNVHLADATIRLTFRTENGRQVVDRVNGQPASLPPWKNRFHVKPDGGVVELPEPDSLYRNEGGGRFTDISAEPGVFLDADGRPAPRYRDWGLGAMFRDFDGDGTPDLYVCNDTGSEDRFWLNTGRGTFRAAPRATLAKASYSSMGIDVADLNRDGRDDFLVVDMLARDRQRRVQQLARSSTSTADAEQPGARPLFSRNTLFLARSDGSYAETALFSGLAASDWSWCPIFLDVDLDGFEDLVVANGFEQDVLDQDTLDGVRSRKWTVDQVRRFRAHYPSWPTAMAAFRNRGNATFEPAPGDWGLQEPGVANGMASADLDGDGDLDLVVNRLNAPPAVYRNDAPAARVAVRLRGRAPNTQGIGARVRLVASGLIQSQEFIAGGRYLSGDQALRVFAVPSRPAGTTNSPRLEVTWRDGSRSVISDVTPDRLVVVEQPATPLPAISLPAISRDSIEPPSEPHFTNVSHLVAHRHRELAFDDWSRQPLLPRRLSRLGPAVGWTDLDGDGWEDLVIGGARGEMLGVYLKRPDQPGFRPYSTARPNVADEVSLVALPGTGKGRDLFVAGSNLKLAADEPSRVSWYSLGQETRDVSLGPVATGPLAAADIDRDGDLDLFVGGRTHAGRYPEPVSSAIWIGADGGFEASDRWSGPLRDLGLASGAVWDDLDLDGDPDLIVTLDWGPVKVFRNRGGALEDATADLGLASRTGLWNGVTTGDFDGDGRPDIAVANWGRNSAYALYPQSPIRAYYGDWHGDGRYPIVEAARVAGRWVPLADRARLDPALPDLQARFPTHRAFAAASLEDVLGTHAAGARFVEVTEFDSGVYLNRGSRFEWIPFPDEAQLAPAFSIHVGDFDGDGTEDLFLTQNFFGYPPGLTRDDAGPGLWLKGRGDGRFTAVDVVTSGIHLLGEQRGAAVADFDHDGRLDLAVARNNDATVLFRNRGARPGLSVTLRGGIGNPDAYGAQIQLVYAGGRTGPLRSIHGGAGLGSLDAATQILGLAGTPESLRIRWPGGTIKTVPVAPSTTRLEVRP